MLGFSPKSVCKSGFLFTDFSYIYNHDGMKGLWLWEDANFSRWRLRGSQITIVELLKEMSTCNGLCGLYPKKWMIWCKMFLAMFVDTSCVKWPEVSMQLLSTHRASKFSLPHSLTLWDSYESRRLFGNHGCSRAVYLANCVEITTRKSTILRMCIKGFWVLSMLDPRLSHQNKAISLEALLVKPFTKKDKWQFQKHNKN